MGFFDDPQTALALLNMAGGFGAAAMPSRMPIPTGAAIGMGAQGLAQGMQAGPEYMKQQIQNKYLPGSLAAGVQRQNIENQYLPSGLQTGIASQQAALPGVQAESTAKQLGLPSAALDALISNNFLKMYGGSVPNTPMPNASPLQQPPEPEQQQTQAQPMTYLKALALSESGGDSKAIGDGGKAVGMFQFHPEAAKEVGIDDRTDPMQSLIGAQKYTEKYGAGTPNPPLWGAVAFKAGPTFAKSWDGDINKLPPAAKTGIQNMDQLMGGQLLGQSQGQAPGGFGSLSPQTQMMMFSKQFSPLAGLQPDYINMMAKKEATIEGAKQRAGAQAKADVETQMAVPKKSAEATGENLGAALKTYNVAAQNMPNVLQRIQDMTKANSVSNFGPFVNDEEGEPSLHNPYVSMGEKIHPEIAQANSVLRQRGSQNVLAELGPQLQQTGARGNKFLETLANAASGLKLNQTAPGRQESINGLLKAYVQNLRAVHDEIEQYGGTASPYPKEAIAPMVKYGLMDEKEGRAYLKQYYGL